MLLLDAVNTILPKLGEHPVTGLTIKHPTLGIILPEIDRTLDQLLLKGWWFNQYEYTAYPDSENEIALGSNVLSFVAQDVTAVHRQKTGKLFNPETLTYKWDAPVKGVLTERVDFEELPESAAAAVLYSALVTSFVTDVGLAAEVQSWQVLSASAHSDLLAEHLRHRKYSTRGSRRFQRIRNALRGS